MADIQCRKKDCPEKLEEKVQLHHLIPRFMGGKDIDGRKWLCEKHHDKIQGFIATVIWKYVIEEKREQCRKAVKTSSEWWLRK